MGYKDVSITVHQHWTLYNILVTISIKARVLLFL